MSERDAGKETCLRRKSGEERGGIRGRRGKTRGKDTLGEMKMKRKTDDERVKYRIKERRRLLDFRKVTFILSG